ncbi:MAG: hypothetical protein FWE32_09420 [Oscillospiraceae bacterium]|nr:hypothetical protein [Oscillospiraceae bacterium]
MGYEYSIVLENGEYPNAVQALTEAFQSFSAQYVVEVDNNGFSLMCSEDKKWPDSMQIIVRTADEYTYAVPKDTQYLYCLFYIGGDEAYRAMELIKSTLCRLEYAFEMDDL